MSVAAPPRPRPRRKSPRGTRAQEQSTPLGAYTAPDGREREILSTPAPGGSTLVIDRDACTRCDERLIAHLPADEPEENPGVMCALYLADRRGRHCRRVCRQDREAPPQAPRATPSTGAHNAPQAHNAPAAPLALPGAAPDPRRL